MNFKVEIIPPRTSRTIRVHSIRISQCERIRCAGARHHVTTQPTHHIGTSWSRATRRRTPTWRACQITEVELIVVTAGGHRILGGGSQRERSKVVNRSTLVGSTGSISSWTGQGSFNCHLIRTVTIVHHTDNLSVGYMTITFQLESSTSGSRGTTCTISVGVLQLE